MNRYPLSTAEIQKLASDIVESDSKLRELVTNRDELLGLALKHLEHSEAFQKEAEKLHKAHGTNTVGEVHPEAIKLGEPTILSPADMYSETPMSEEELAAYFNEAIIPKPKEMDFTGMSKEEVEDWEKQQDNSNDIYKLAARVKNLARVDGSAALTPVGEALCNTYTHVLKSFYDFADTIQDRNTKRKLYNLIRQNEGMPGNLISVGTGTKGKRT